MIKNYWLEELKNGGPLVDKKKPQVKRVTRGEVSVHVKKKNKLRASQVNKILKQLNAKVRTKQEICKEYNVSMDYLNAKLMEYKLYAYSENPKQIGKYG